MLDHPQGACALLAALVFLPSLAGGFLYDDFHLVVANRAVQEMNSILDVMRYDIARPIVNLSFALQYRLHGLTPWPYHAVNVAAHVMNAALAARLLGWAAARAAEVLRPRVALATALFFAASPMTVETVAYVASRSTALASLGILATLNVAVGLLDGRTTPARWAMALGLFLLALLTKEESASVPLYLLLLDFFFVSGREARGVLRQVRVHAVFFAIVACGLAARFALTGQWLPPGPVDRGRYLVTQLAAFPGTLARAVLPLDPAFYRGVAVAPWPPDGGHILWAVVAIAIVAAAVALVRRQPLFSLAVAWLGAGLLPSSSLVPLGEMVVDHRAYLGGLLALALPASLLARMSLATVAAVVVLAVRTIAYERVMADPVEVWTDATRRAPTDVTARRSLAEALAQDGEIAAAEREHRRAAELDPGSVVTWTNLAAFYDATGRPADAEAAMRRAIALAPRDGQLHDNLGTALKQLGRVEEAAAEFEQAIALDPRLVQPRISLADLLMKRQQWKRAHDLLDEAGGLNPAPGELEALTKMRDWMDARSLGRTAP